MGDTRTDSGQFYPGGKVVPRQPVTPGGGADPNAVHYTAETKTGAQKEQARANIGAMAADTPIPSVGGKLPVKPLPKYLHYLLFDDPYKADAEAWYASLAPDAMGGACSAVRRGGKLYRKYDWTFDSAAEFVVRMSAAEGRHASVGVASLGAALTEDEVMSGVYTPKYRALPGMTLDGINDAGVVAEINVDGGPKTGWHGTGANALHILAAVRWVLDHGETAQQAAEYVAANVKQPTGDMNFHFMVADATKTYIVENGVAHDVTDGVKVLTNYGVFDTAQAGGGKERYQLLAGGADISAVTWTKAYQPGNDWDSDFDSHEQHLSAIEQWAEQGDTKESHRGKTTESGKSWWQSVHTAEYDFAAKTMRVAVQESDEWFTFAAGGAKVELDDEVTQTSANGVKSSGIWAWVKSLLPSWLTAESEEPRGKTDLDVYEQRIEYSDFTYSSDIDGLVSAIGTTQPEFSAGSWAFTRTFPVGGHTYSVEVISGTGDELSITTGVQWEVGPGTVGHLTMTRTRESVKVPVGKLAHAMKDSGGALPSGIAKLGAGGELIAAKKSSEHGANADYRDPKDNVCHETEYGEWNFSEILAKLAEENPGATNLRVTRFTIERQSEYYEDSFSRWLEVISDRDAVFNDYYGPTGTKEYIESLTVVSGSKGDAKKDKVASEGESFVTFDVVTALVDGVKALLGNLASGYSTFAAWIASKLDRAAFADAYDTEKAYAVGDVVDYNGVIYQCVAATSGGAWDASKWEVRKLDDFFRESNSLLTGTIASETSEKAEKSELPIPRVEKTGDFTTESYKRFVVASMPSAGLTLTLHTPTGSNADVFECRFEGGSLSADASVEFSDEGEAATTMDTDCGTVKAGKVALMSAFWNGTTWDVNWKVEG